MQSEVVEENIQNEVVEPTSKAKKKKCRTQPLSSDAREDKRSKTKSKKKIGELSTDSRTGWAHVETEKLVKQRVDMVHEQVVINLAKGNKRRKQEAKAEKESAATGAELTGSRRRKLEAPVGITQSEFVEVNSLDKSACRSRNRDALHGHRKLGDPVGHDLEKGRQQNTLTDKGVDVALRAVLHGLLRRCGEGAANKETNKRGKKKRPSKDKEVITAELADKVGDDAQTPSKKRGKSRGKQKIGGIKDDKGFAGNIPQASQKKKKKNTLRRASSKKKVKTADSPPLEHSAGGEQVTPTSGNEEVELNKGRGKLKSHDKTHDVLLNCCHIV
ncbi:hypothetical protein M514_00673 [Trichuris suis]|uniref:Uncharacterized protein n=1 Tax=Trichuris suis TaxID=68888 RepID=A0A085MV33_9BILA|nr:hypothetical protein M514_00673 [Trichuris suis]